MSAHANPHAAGVQPRPPAPPAAAAWTALALLVAAPAGAQEPALDLTQLSLEVLMRIEVREVYGAALRTQQTTDAPSSVTIVTEEEIRLRGYRTLAELLRGVGGFYSTYDRNYQHVGLRGFYLPGDYNSRIMLLVDGHRLNENVYGSAGLGYESPIDVDLIERVEVIRGPGSALYGSSAFFAVVNVITRRGRDVGGLEAAAEAGSRESYRARVTWGGETADGIDWLVSLRGNTSAGGRLFYEDFAATTPSGGVTRDTDYLDAWHFFGQVSSGPWTLQSAYAWREKGIPTGAFETVFDDPDNRTVDAQGYVDLAWAEKLSEQTSAVARLHYDDYRYRGWYIYDYTSSGGPPDVLNDDRGRGRWAGAVAQLSFEQLERQRWTVGGELRWNIQQDQRNEDDFGVNLDDRRDGLDWGAFVQDEIALRDDLTLIAGGRYDHYDTFGGTLNPRAGLIWRPGPETAWKLLYGRAFRAPNVYELYYDDGATQMSNPDLEPERITTYEAVYERFFAGTQRLSLSLFHYEIDDLIVQDVDPGSGLLVFENSDAVRARGLEAEYETVLFGDLRATVSQAFQRTEDRETDDEIVNSPKHITQLHVEAPLFGGPFTAALEVLHVGSRATFAGDRVDSYVLTNLILTAREVKPGLDCSLGLYNLFGTSYRDPVGAEIVQDSIEQDGFALALRLTLRR